MHCGYFLILDSEDYIPIIHEPYFMKTLPLKVVSIVGCVAILLSSVACNRPQGRFVSISGEMLGTNLNISAYTNSQSLDIYNRVMEIDEEMKNSISVFNEKSLLSRINKNQTDSLDNHIYANLKLARDIYEFSDGIYDVTVKPLVSAYGFVNNMPQTDVNIDSIMRFVGFDKISFDDDYIYKKDSRIELDFNSIAKGYTVDLVAHELELFGIKNYMVEIGGEIRCRGINAKKGAWRVGVETPYDGNDIPGQSIQQVLSITDCAMATSGNYRRYYIDESGNKVAHIIDAKSGRSAVTDLLSATVVAPTCAEADAYATMFVAMGVDCALQKAKELEAEGVMVYFIGAGENGDFAVYYSAELAPMMSHTEGFQAI